MNSTILNECIKINLENNYTENEEYDYIIKSAPGYTLWGITFIFINLFGILGNTITIVVLHREITISTLNILLTGLAISDLIAPQANCLIAIIYYHLYSFYHNSVIFFKLYSFINYVLQPLSTAFTMSSSWIITVTTLFRLIVVCKPFKARTMINKRLAFTSLSLIFTLSLMAILPFYLCLERVNYCTDDNQHVFTVFSYSYASQSFFNTYYLLILQALCFYLPWLTSACLWIALIRSLKNAERQFMSLSRTCGDSFENRHQNVHMRLTYMIITLCFINLTCQLCTFVFIFELVHNKVNTSERPSAKQMYPHFMAYTFLLNNIFLGLNHSCNIFIYLVTNPKFRANFMGLFTCVRQKEKRKQRQNDHLFSLKRVNTMKTVEAEAAVAAAAAVVQTTTTTFNFEKICK